MRELTGIERFLFTPLFGLAGIALLFYGVHVFNHQKVRLRAIARLLYRKDYVRGATAQMFGIWCILIGALLALGSLLMTISGHALLPS